MKNKGKKTQKKKEKNVKTNKYDVYVYAILVFVITFIAFYGSLGNEFTNWDDPSYVLNNHFIKRFDWYGIQQLFTNRPYIGYIPITMISYAFDYHLGELDPTIYHLTNFILHLANTLLVFWFIYLMISKIEKTKKYKKQLYAKQVAFIVAGLFGIHVMHVESVAWISERKDLLYSFFMLLTMVFYVYYLDVFTKKKNGYGKYYIYSLIFLAFALLSKGMAAVTFLVLLSVDYIAGRNLLSKRVILEKIPYLLLAFVYIFGSYLVVYVNKPDESISQHNFFPLLERIAFACYGYITYFIKLIVPFKLSAIYPYPVNSSQQIPFEYYLYVLPVLLIIGLFFYLFKRNKQIVFGILFFTVNTVMILQLFPYHDFLIADRYTYMSSIGVFFIIGEGYRYIMRNKPRLKFIIIAIFTSYFVYIGIYTINRCKLWENSELLFTDVIEKYPNADAPYKNRGDYYARELQEYDKALKDYSTYLSINNKDPKLFSNRGNVYGLMKKYELSIADYTKAIELNDKYVDSYVNRGVTYMKLKEFHKAINDFNLAIKISPDNISVFKNRAFAYMNIKEYENSLADYNELINRRPNESFNYINRGIVFFNTKKYNDAINDFSISLRLSPNQPNVYFNRSFAYSKIGKIKEAYDDAQKAKKLGYNVGEQYLDNLKKQLF